MSDSFIPGKVIVIGASQGMGRWMIEKIFLPKKYKIVACDVNIDPLKPLECFDLFSWDKIPGNNNEKLINFLNKSFNAEWTKNAEIVKTDDEKIIQISDQNNYISLKLNDENTEVNLKIDDGRTDKFIVKKGNNICKKILIVKKIAYDNLKIRNFPNIPSSSL